MKCREKLQSDLALELRVNSPVDHAHATSSELLLNSVVGDLLSNHRDRTL